MAVHLERLTTNAAGDGWIDNTPGGVATGYQAQNTNLTARFLGGDLTTLKVENGNLYIKGNSGAIDIDGVPYTMMTDFVTSLASLSEETWFKISDTANPAEKEIELTTIAPTWNEVKNYYETSAGERVLNWKFNRGVYADNNTNYFIERLLPPEPFLSDEINWVTEGSRHFMGSGVERQFVVRDAGWYGLAIVGAGEPKGSSGFDDTGARGGAACRCELYLEKGSRIYFYTAYDNPGSNTSVCSVNSGARLSMSALYGSITNINVTGGKVLSQGEYRGGNAYFGDDDGDAFLGTGGGGAGFFFNGIDATALSGMAIGRHFDFGNGEDPRPASGVSDIGAKGGCAEIWYIGR